MAKAEPPGRWSSRKRAVASAEVQMLSSVTSNPPALKRAARSRGVYIELFVRTRKGVPRARRRARNSAEPSIGSSSRTMTPSMSISHDRVSWAGMAAAYVPGIHPPCPRWTVVAASTRRSRVGHGGRRPREVEHQLVGVAPEPVLSRLERPDHRVAGGVVVPGGVAARRAVATAHMTTGLAQPQMHPIPPPGRQAVLATRCRGHDTPDHPQVPTSHGSQCGATRRRRASRGRVVDGVVAALALEVEAGERDAGADAQLAEDLAQVEVHGVA